MRATSADNEGMPIVFSPPAVSALNTSVARYLSGSRAALTVAGVGERLAFVFADEVFVFTFAFELVSARWHALPARLRSITTASDIRFGVLKAVIFIDSPKN